MLINRICYIAIIIFCAAIFVFSNTYASFVLLILVLALPLVSLAFLFLASKSVDAEVIMPISMSKQKAEFKCKIDNNSFIPVMRIAVILEMENRFTGGSVTKKIFVSLTGKSSIEGKLHISRPKAGNVVIFARKITIYDFFGIFCKKRIPSNKGSSIIYPNIDPIEIHMEKPIETSGEGTRYSRTKKGNDVNEVLAIRDYDYGDEIRKIHWKLSSKIDKLLVRDFSLPLNYSIFLLAEFIRGDEDVVDGMAEVFLSLSSSLLEYGVNHNLAWYDYGNDEFKVYGMDDIEDIEISAAGVLGSFTQSEGNPALDLFMQSGYHNNESLLIYLTTNTNEEALLELEVTQRIKIIVVGKSDAPKLLSDMDVSYVSVEGKSKGLPELAI